MKFKVNDRIMLNPVGKRSCSSIPKENYEAIKGKPVIVKKAWTSTSNYKDWIFIDGSPYCWLQDDFVLVSGQSIVIYQKDREVIASLKSGKETIKTAKATYNPNDAKEGKPFDFNIGAKTAFQRLIGEEVKAEVKAEPKTDDGFKARCVKSNRTWFTTGKIYEIKNGKFTDDDGEEYPLGSRLKNIEDLRQYASGNTWEEVKGNIPAVLSFDWQAFKSGKFAVHCDTEEKAKAFLKECEYRNINWASGDKATSKTYHEENICYRVVKDGGLNVSSAKYYRQKNIDIVEYAPSVREIHRPAKVGEWIKVTNVHGIGYEVGDIAKVVRATALANVVIPSSGDYYGLKKQAIVALDEYVVLENYKEATK